MIERTFDYRRVKRLAPWQPLISNEVIYLIDRQDNEDVGLWSFHKAFDGLMIHADMGLKCNGKKAIESAKAAFKWIFKNISCGVIYASIPKENKAACHTAVKSGMNFNHTEHNKRFYKVMKWETL